MHTAPKGPRMGSPSASSSRGATGVPSKQGGGEACLVWVLSQVRVCVWGGEGQGTTCSTPAAEGLVCRCAPARLPHCTGSWGWRTNFHSWEKKVREDEPGRVLWPETCATHRAEGMKVGFVGVAQPRLRVSPVLRGPGGERWWGRGALLLLVVVGCTGRG